MGISAQTVGAAGERPHGSRSEKQLYIIMLICTLVFTAISAVLSIRSIRQFAYQENVDSLEDIAGALSANPSIAKLCSGAEGSSADLAQSTLNLYVELFGASQAAGVFDRDARFILSTDPQIAVGSLSHNAAAITALAPGEDYIKKDNSGVPKLWVYKAVLSSGEVVGYVGIGQNYSYTGSLIDTLLLRLTLVFVLLAASLVALVTLHNREIRRLLGGLPAEKMGSLTRQREASIDAIHEAYCSTDNEWRLTLANTAAHLYLGIPDNCKVGTDLTSIGDFARLKEVLGDQPSLRDYAFDFGGRHLMVNVYRAQFTGSPVGFVITALDITKVTSLSEELSGLSNTVEYLRVVNHDFSNKMQVVMGYLETRQYDLAKEYIGGLQAMPAEKIRAITENVLSNQLSALLIGKQMRATELGIRLVLAPGSHFSQCVDGCTVDIYATIIGNLIENAIEELDACLGQLDKEIIVELYSDSDNAVISVSDNGRGIPQEVVEHILELGFTTKAQDVSRGIGLAVIQQMVGDHNGTLEIDSEEGEGSCFTVHMRRP